MLALKIFFSLFFIASFANFNKTSLKVKVILNEKDV